MAAAPVEGVNFMRVFVYNLSSISPERTRNLVALGYAAARTHLVAPKAMLIRSDMHDFTTINGKRVKDPKGWHSTISFKCADQVVSEYHVSSHAYTNGKDDFTLREATHTREKPDDTRRGGPKSGKVVWPDEEFLEEYKDSPIGYSHIRDQV